MQIDIYTDGSCSPEGIAGWAYVLVCKHNGQTIKRAYKDARDNMTNQSAELMAVLSALQHLTRPTKVTIHSDSAYIVNCFHNGWYLNWMRNGWMNSKGKPVANQNIWPKLIHLSDQHEITYNKVKAHAGHRWNEFADSLAGAAVRTWKEQVLRDQEIAAGVDTPPRVKCSFDDQYLDHIFDPTQLIKEAKI